MANNTPQQSLSPVISGQMQIGIQGRDFKTMKILKLRFKSFLKALNLIVLRSL